MKIMKILALGFLAWMLTGCAGPAKMKVAPDAASQYAAHLAAGRQYLQQEEPDKAIAELNLAISADPKAPQPYNLLGMAYFQKKDYPRAAEYFQRTIDLDASSSSAHGNLGSVFILIQKYGEAEKLLARAIALDPKNVSALFSLGSLCLAEGKTDEGMRYLRDGVQIDPYYLEHNKAFIAGLTSNITAEMNFAFAEIFAAAGNIETTISYLNKAKSLGFNDWRRILEDKEFDKIRDDPRIRAYIKI
jgi:tetratricopeptide (TPR) repeat protein